MKRLTLLVAAFLIVTDAAGGTHRSLSPCRLVPGGARFCTLPAHAATPNKGDTFARNFAGAYNLLAARKHWAQTIIGIGCKPYGEAAYACTLELQTLKGRLCGVVVIDTGYRIFVNHRVNCATVSFSAVLPTPA